MTASTVSDRIEALSRPPVVSSPRPSLMCWPSPRSRATPGEGAGVDDRGAQLGQPALGEVRVGGVERLGDDDAEHRVAEELQALVGGQPAVLVGERPVRQRALEQPGIQDRISECSAKRLGGQWTVRSLSGGAQRTWRRSARAPYWPQVPHARCGRCLAPQAGLAQVTRVGATAFHCDRRWRVLLRDIFRFGTATVISCCLVAGCSDGQSGWVSLVVLWSCVERGEPGPARVDRCLVRVVRVVGQPRATLGAQSGTVVLAQRAGTVVRAPPRPAAGARGRAGRPRACWSRRRGRGRRAPRPCRAGRRRRTAPAASTSTSSSIGSRHRAHSPSSAAVAVPVTSTPSMTASSRRSSSTGDPSGTREDFDAQLCRRRHRERHLPLGPRAAAELASIEHERRSRVQAGHEVTSGVRTQTEPRNRIRRVPGGAKRPRLSAGRSASRRSASRAVSRSSTNSGTSPDTSPPNVATSLTRLEARKDALGAGRARRPSRRPARREFIWAICSS